ncbi:MAG TPA: hypothetical protein VN673_18585 [Clostridia bacterium]|nr:hypothetical protein [Clostridia bacterium]
MHYSFVSLLAVASLSLFSVRTAPAATITENFSSDPLAGSWSSTGETNLFYWNSTNQNLEVTWDSSKTNSFFSLPLPVTLTDTDDFTVAFDLQLSEATAGIDPQRPNIFQLSAGLLNLPQALASTFNRVGGVACPNVMDFSFFPDPDGVLIGGSSVTAMAVDHTGNNWSSGGFAPLDLSMGDLFRITMTYHAAERKLSTQIVKNGAAFGTLVTTLGASFLGFQLSHLAVASYSDEGQDPAWAGSILARGTIDNVELIVPDPTRLQGQWAAGKWEVQFNSRVNYTYTLERSEDFQTWSDASAPVEGTGAVLSIQETNAPAAQAFYRIRVAQ